jgi:hypothetical protein
MRPEAGALFYWPKVKFIKFQAGWRYARRLFLFRGNNDAVFRINRAVSFPTLPSHFLNTFPGRYGCEEVEKFPAKLLTQAVGSGSRTAEPYGDLMQSVSRNGRPRTNSSLRRNL